MKGSAERGRVTQAHRQMPALYISSFTSPFFLSLLLLLVDFTRIFSIRAGIYRTMASHRFPQEYSMR